MTIRTVGILIASVLLAGCGDEKAGDNKADGSDDFGNFEDVLRAGDNCRTTDKGEAKLTIKGNPGDGFRVIYLCGTVEVSRCTATIPAGATTANCDSGPNPVPNNKVKRCQVGPKNGNSAAAKFTTVICQ